MTKLRVGIIGQGRSGRDIHVAGLSRPLPKELFEIAAVCDLLPERCKETCEENPGCQSYVDYREMLKDKSLDLIVNATTNEQHPRITVEILDAGFHCLCEKPAARNVADFDTMLAAEKRSGKTLAFFQEAHFSPAFRKVMEVINSGKLGRIAMAKVFFCGWARRWDWQTMQSKEAGNLSNTGPHPLDQALEIFGDADPETICCFMDRVNSFGDAEDHIKLILAGKDHPTIDVEISSCSAYNPFVYQLFAERGGLTATHSEVKWKYYDPQEAPKQVLIQEPLEGRKYCGEPLKFYEESWKAADSYGNAYMAEKLYQNLYDVLVNGGKLVVPNRIVRRQIQIIEECHKQNPFPKKF